MHELGIATSLLREAQKEAARHPGKRLCKVRVRLGDLAGVNAEALSFCFEVLARKDKLQPLELEIESCARRQRCSRCELIFSVLNFDLHCPACGAEDTDFVSGDELELAGVELDEYDASAAATQSA